MADLGVDPPAKALKFRGGEREALSRLEHIMVSDDIISFFKICRNIYGVCCLLFAFVAVHALLFQ